MFSKLFRGAVLGFAIAATGATVAHAKDMASWQRSVVSLVAKKQVYPREAMSQEVEGRARVRVTINRSGQITDYVMVEKTGNAILDAEVLRMKDRINPLPTPPASISDTNLTFVLPLSWVLQ